VSIDDDYFEDLRVRAEAAKPLESSDLASERFIDAASPRRVLELLDSHRHLRNLLARIHRDGGHHTEACGLEKSVADADAAVAMYIGAYDAQQRS
jgi:hypothetical protein